MILARIHADARDMNRRHFLHLWIMLLTVSGCGVGSAEVPNRVIFDAAVRAYLEKRSMNLSIANYEKFNLAEDGAKATAVIALVLAGEGHARVKIRFLFIFRKTDGRWQAVSHEKVKI